MNLINKALEESRLFRQGLKDANLGTSVPLTPLAVRSVFYLRVRESLNRGAREAVKLIPNKSLRSPAYSILIMACYDIFHTKKTPQLMAYYNKFLDELIGDH